MRLTLRTLLAYLDEILDPKDADELKKRVEESEFASGLAHRIRSATQRLRLGAPPLDGRGMGADPNTVAEYLDNVLAADRVPDFEKVCLESDVHLAEVAACHQVLTLVLGEPALVHGELREGMYRIGAPETQRRANRDTPPTHPPVVAEMAPPAPAPVAAAIPSPAVVAAVEQPATPVIQVTPARREPLEVPEYLRAGRRASVQRLALSIVVAFLLASGALRLLGPFDHTHPLARLFGAGEPAVVSQQPGAPPDSGAPSDVSPAGKGEAPGPAREPGDTGKPPATGTQETPESKPEEPAPAKPATPDPKDKQAPADSQPPVAVMPREPSGPAAKAGVPGTETKPQEKKPATEPGASNGPNDGKISGKSSVKPDAPAVAGGIVGVVKFVDQQFLARLDRQANAWNRLPGRAPLAAGDQLFAFPTYRPEITLNPGVQVALVGAMFASPLPTTPQGEPGLGLGFGRALISTAGVAGAKIHLAFGHQRGTATFVDATSEMAIEVSRYLPPGSNPETAPADSVVQVYCTAGRIQWLDRAEVAEVPIDSGQRRVIIGERAETVAIRDLPAWIQRKDLTDVERLASMALEPQLGMERPLVIALQERTEDRKAEVRSLAARCLAYIDSYDPLVKELTKDLQRSHWAATVDSLREATAMSPAHAARVHAALDQICGNDGASAYRLLWGFSPQQLQEGSDALLVDGLSHEALAIRVLAYENLRRITGKTHQYRPEWTEARRKASVQDWRQELQKGGVIYDKLPAGPAAQ